MSNLSVRHASEAAIGVAMLRHFASAPGDSPRLDAMASEILGPHSGAKMIRVTIHTLAEREHGWIKERATHATISPRVNERRERELDSIAKVHAASLAALQLSPVLRTGDAEGTQVLLECFVQAMQGIDEFPMGVPARQALRALLRSEVELAVPEALRPAASALLVQAETIYLKRCAESVYAHYDAPGSGPSLSS